jgi:hypothetical protein
MLICELTCDAINFNDATMHVTRKKRGQPTTHRIRGDELRALRKLYGATAIAEISIFASRGKRATSTAARAGGAFLKYVA